jgi:hypothetical protein
MTRQTIHRVYTEDQRRAAIVRVISKQFDSFTLQPNHRVLPRQAGEIQRAGVRGRKRIAGQMPGCAYSKNKIGKRPCW